MEVNDSLYEGTEYVVPEVVRILGNILRAPRGHYSRNSTDLFSPNRETQLDYAHGLLSVMAALLIFWLFWAFVLFVFKFRGEEFGCAAGLPFSSQDQDEEVSTDDDEEESSVSSLGSLSRTLSENSGTKLIQTNAVAVKGISKNQIKAKKNKKNHVKRAKKTGKDRVLHRRETRSRLCFMFSGSFASISVPLILVLSFGPLKQAMNDSNDVVALANDAIFQVHSSLGSIEDAIAAADEILQSGVPPIEALCPNIDDLDQSVSFELIQLINTTTADFESIMENSVDVTELIRVTLDRIMDGIKRFELAVEKGEGAMWIVPAVLFAVCIITFIAMLGVILATKGKSGPDFQKKMSYVVLPLLIASTLACWIIVMAASLGTMLGADLCTANSADGSPDDTIRQTLGVLNLDPNSRLFQLTLTYTNNCNGPFPSDDIDNLESTVEETIDELWNQLSRIDSAGRSETVNACGGTELESLLVDARNLAKLLTTIRRSLDSAATSVSCPRINPLYVSLVHDAICTDATAAVARGFAMFLLLSISLMIMISLRASWLHIITEEKVYHNERDMAQNMILDEHEEYLAYISKYKHEWEEYRGFDNNELGSEVKEEEQEEGWSSASSTSFDGSNREQWEDESGMTDETSGLQVVIVETRETFPMEAPSPSSHSQMYSPATTSSMNRGSVHTDIEGSPARPPAQNPDFRDRRAVVRSKSHVSKPDGSLFEKYGIEPGNTVRTTTHQPADPAAVADPPERGTSFFDKYGVEPRRASQSRSEGDPSPHRPSDPPARRPVFNAKFTEDGEVEIELDSSKLSQGSECSL